MTAVSIFAVLEIFILAINITKASKCKGKKFLQTLSFLFLTPQSNRHFQLQVKNFCFNNYIGISFLHY